MNDKRIEKLEAKVRRMHFGVVVVLVAGGLALTMGQVVPKAKPHVQKVIEAEKFVLKDKDGETRGTWQVLEDGATAFGLFDTRMGMRRVRHGGLTRTGQRVWPFSTRTGTSEDYGA